MSSTWISNVSIDALVAAFDFTLSRASTVRMQSMPESSPEIEQTLIPSARNHEKFETLLVQQNLGKRFGRLFKAYDPIIELREILQAAFLQGLLAPDSKTRRSALPALPALPAAQFFSLMTP